MCNITKLLLVICFSLAVTNAVDGYTFRLNNSTRIRRDAKNNGKSKGCANSSDFRCKSGDCIPEEKECDGTIDCQDATDETNSCHRIKCPQYLFRCQYGACINPDYECDGKTDCRDNSDETSAKCKNTAPTEQCTSGQFRCNSGQCISEDQKCDGTKHCQDGSDETSATCFSITCPGYTYRCKYGACVDGNAECDGIVQCYDGSDEDPDKCKTSQTPAPPIPTPTPVTQSPGPGPGPSPGEGACTLPSYPEFGKWTIVGNFNFSPGMRVQAGTLLQLTCQDGYKFDGSALVLCQNGQWSSEIGKCSRTCPPIFSTPTTQVTCTYKNQETVNCTDAVDGTLARYKCTYFYEDLGLANKPVHICRDGTWDQRKPQCTPVCGQKSVSSTPLVINGTNVQKGDYPWQVAIYTIEKKVLICGGSLINQRVIITAAHCITDPKGKLKSKELYIVAVGKYYRPYDDPRDANEAQFSPLDKMFIPEQYRGETQNYLGDIAVLVTTKTFTLSRRVQPVCVDWGSNYASELSSPFANRYGYVTGWGYTSENSNPSEKLKELKVPAVTYEKCNQNLPEDYNIYLTYDKLCAGYIDQGTSICRGDTGGGLVFKHRNRYYLTGIVSLSPQSQKGGCDSQQYTLYTSVAKYTDLFLLEKVIQYETHQPQQTMSNIGECTLPPHPNNGRLSVLGSKLSSNPGSAVPSGTTIQVICDQSHVLQGPSTVDCTDGQWLSPVGICLAQCPPLMSSRSMKVSCHGVTCINNTHGTVATFKCAPFYEYLDLNINPFRICENGEWRPKVPRCVPVCGVKPEFDTQQNSDYPWNAAIYRKDEEDKRRFICAGTLINERIILTSAQCISDKDGETLSPTLFKVAVGKSTKDYDDPQDVEAQFSELEDISVPDEYRGNIRKYRADIAIVITKRPFNMTERVQLLCLDWKNTFAKEFEHPKIRGQIAANFESQTSPQFFEIEVPFVDDIQCYKQLSEDSEFDASYYTFDKLCSGYINLNKTTSCNLNLGIGLISKNRHDNRYYLTGIASVFVSNRSRNCNNKKWVLFTQVSKYVSSFIFEKNKLYTPLDTPYFQTFCGVKSVQAQTLIIDGNNVTKGDYPWQVAIYRGSTAKKELFCGGSLINQRIILTAAHCMTDSQGNKRSKEIFTVAVGKYYRDFNHPDDKNAQFSAVIDIFVPDLYQGELQNYVGDIAILITEKSFVLSRQVMPVCVDWENKYEGQLLRPHAKGYATGWGLTKENSNPSQILKDLEVPYIEKNQCKKEIPEDYDVYLTFDKICSGYLNESKSVCRGDSGGGLVFKNGIDDRYYITGIVSLSPQAPTGGCNSQQYALYTKVSQYVKDFIGKKAQIFWR